MRFVRPQQGGRGHLRVGGKQCRHQDEAAASDDGVYQTCKERSEGDEYDVQSGPLTR